MNIALLADDEKKELMIRFCTAYSGILAKHHILATGYTGGYIEEKTGLKIEKLLMGELGGTEQLISRVKLDEIDILIFFRSGNDDMKSELTRQIDNELLMCCDQMNVIYATNIATAEPIVLALDRGDLVWREYWRISDNA